MFIQVYVKNEEIFVFQNLGKIRENTNKEIIFGPDNYKKFINFVLSSLFFVIKTKIGYRGNKKRLVEISVNYVY